MWFLLWLNLMMKTNHLYQVKAKTTSNSETRVSYITHTNMGSCSHICFNTYYMYVCMSVCLYVNICSEFSPMTVDLRRTCHMTRALE